MEPPHCGTRHRRAYSDMSYLMSDPAFVVLVSGPATMDESSTSLGSEEEDLLSIFMDLEKIGSVSPSEVNNALHLDPVMPVQPATTTTTSRRQHHHRQSLSVDESVLRAGDVSEAKKAMPPDKLAELAAIDPKRAKRILANRQSAARSKERKAHYISQLERQVRTLQTEATTLSAQLLILQRDTTGLTTENSELRLRLQVMEQQAQLRDTLNDALQHEVEKLKVATGESANSSENFRTGLHQITLDSSFFPLSQIQRQQQQQQQQQQYYFHHGIQSPQLQFTQSQATFNQ